MIYDETWETRNSKLIKSSTTAMQSKLRSVKSHVNESYNLIRPPIRHIAVLMHIWTPHNTNMISATSNLRFIHIIFHISHWYFLVLFMLRQYRKHTARMKDV